MKKCVIVSDTFKGTLTSREIGEIAREVISKLFPDCEVVTVPVADGGEGTVECFMSALHTAPISVEVQGPYGESVSATYTRKGAKAVIEMASAAGLPLVGAHKDPKATSTYGVGQIIRHAIEHGCTEILLGLGGSATNDGGCGCAAALGVKFLDDDGKSFVPTGGTLSRIRRIDPTDCRTLLRGVRITAMCDITNPLYGPLGAAYIFGPQKGADYETVLELDEQLRCLNESLCRELEVDISQYPGAGAAGGMGAGCAAFFGAELKSGIDAILDLVDFDACVEGADLIITGEGRIDAQSVSGKVLSGILKRTRPKDIPLIALVGSISESAASAYEMGVTAMFSINREALDFEKSACNSRENYKKTLEDILRLVKAIERRDRNAGSR